SSVVKQAGGIWFEHTKPSDGGMYFVKVTIGNCWDTGHTYVTVKPLPDTPKATSNSPICVGETLQLSGSTTTQGVTYRWEGPNSFAANGATANKNNIAKTDEGDYLLYAKKNGCESRPGSTKLDVGIPLVALAITGDTTLCPGDRLLLSAKTSNPAGIEWKKDNDTSVISILRTLSISPVKATDAGTYSVTQEEVGCKSPPTYITVKIPDIRTPQPENNGPLCIGETLNLSIKPTPDGTYAWTGPGGFASNAQNPALADVTEATEGTYIIKTQLEYCSITDSTSVVIKPMPEIKSISSNSPVCTATMLELYTESTLPNSSFEWTGPNNFKSDKQNPTAPFDGSMAGTYQVRTTTDKCISAPAMTEVEMREGPGGSVARSNSPINEGATLELYANNDKDSVSFSWKGPDGFTSDERNPVIPIATYRNSGEYELTSSYNGCTTTTTTIVSVKDILGITLDLYPNPNKGKFTISGITQTDETLTMNIYNHQGMIVHKSFIQPDRSKFDTVVDLGNTASGVYILQLISGIEKRTVRFTVIQQ
ncbi:MAG: T9SS type A sorting domain-containing protein, partial [Chitinophagaceae bacterium]|nr:T9SS type A sorting domain-containing protein [Chitinophagaceae bacterium]